ncbi:TetR/AcrR family transcriptional regulator [Rhodococcus sp. WMMA185]|uniref:TetR/AcrR family transcriptional regulator n=1 Tax=Rhodococcus sp. WMMA185 TaxID=679318 RepID=UPI0008784C9C|nr:TetR/AcrR family transcriptional regulator [Rhodococcus sp. WMMA185]
MPRLVDHEVRRREITSAVKRVVIRRGLEAVTFQSVAAEAGISVRLVQYYFGTKREFLLATHRSVMEDAGNRFTKQLSTLGDDVSPRSAVCAILMQLLPLDAVRREEAVVLGAFAAAAITGQGISAEETLAAPRALVSIVESQLTRAGATTPHLDAELILAAAGGIAQGMVQGHYTDQAGVELIDHLLDRVV